MFIARKAYLNQISGLIRNGYFGRENERLPPSHDFAVSFGGIFRAKRWIADEHLVHDHAQRPPIARRRIPGLHEHLGSDVIRCAHLKLTEKDKTSFVALTGSLCQPTCKAVSVAARERHCKDLHMIAIFRGTSY